MHYIRSKTFDIVFACWTIILGSAIPILAVFGRPSHVRAISRAWSKGIIFGLKYIVGLTYVEKNRHNIPNGPVIFACNHQSSWETLTFNVLIPDVCIVLKESLYRFPIVGWYLRHSPMIAVDRSRRMQALRQMVTEAKYAFESGRSILIFPEGTRQPVYAQVPYNRGVALLYRQLNATVVPVAINSGVYWSPDGFMKYDGNITVSYLPCIQPGLSDDEFMDKLKKSIDEEKDKLAKNLDVDLWISAHG